jgi:serine/threonine protein kinase
MQQQGGFVRRKARGYRTGIPRPPAGPPPAPRPEHQRGVKRGHLQHLQVLVADESSEQPRSRQRSTTESTASSAASSPPPALPSPTQVSVKIGQGTFGECFWYIDGVSREARVKKRMALLTTDKQGLVLFRPEVLREIAVHQLLGRITAAGNSVATTGVRFSRQIQYFAEQRTIQIENLTWHPLTLSELVERHRHDLGSRLRALPLILRHILEGLERLHTHATCHGDLSATNVLLDVSDVETDSFPTIHSARLTDFGSTILEPHASCRQCCSWWFRAPELFERECDRYDLPGGVEIFDPVSQPKSRSEARTACLQSGSTSVLGPWNDVWSVGALMAFVINGGSPFASSADPWTSRQLIQSSLAFTDAEATLTQHLVLQGTSTDVCDQWRTLFRGLTETAIGARWSVRSALTAVGRLEGVEPPSTALLSPAPPPPEPSLSPSATAAWSEPMASKLPDRILQSYSDNLATFVHLLKAAQWPELAPLAASIWQRWIGAMELAQPGFLSSPRIRLGAFAAIYLAALHVEKPLTAEKRLRLSLYLPRTDLMSHALSICNVLQFDLVRPTVFGLISRRTRGPLPQYVQELLLYTALHAPWIGFSPHRLFWEVVHRYEMNSLVPCFPLSTLWLTLTAACVPQSAAAACCTVQRLLFWLVRMVRSLPLHTQDYATCEQLVLHLAAFVTYHQPVWREEADAAETTSSFLLSKVIDPLRLLESSFDGRWRKLVSDLVLRFQAFLPTCSKKSTISTSTTKQIVVDGTL